MSAPNQTTVAPNPTTAAPSTRPSASNPTRSTTSGHGWHRRSAQRRHRRSLRVVVGLATILAIVIGGLATAIGITWTRLERAVHHVSIVTGPPARLASSTSGPATPSAEGHRVEASAIVLALRLPGASADVVLVHDQAGRADVMTVPGRLLLAAAGGHRATVAQVTPAEPVALVRTVEDLGVQVTSYVGLDLEHVNRRSPLALLLTGHVSLGSLLADPLALDHLLGAVAHHLFLGRRTTLGDALGLLRLRSCPAHALPVRRVGAVAVPARRAAQVVRAVLSGTPPASCHGSVARLLAA